MLKYLFLLSLGLLLGRCLCQAQGNLLQFSSESGTTSNYKSPVFNQKNSSLYAPKTKHVSAFQASQQKYDLSKQNYKNPYRSVGTDKIKESNSLNRISYYNNPFYYKHHRQINNVQSSYSKKEKEINAIQNKYDLSRSSLNNFGSSAKDKATILSNKLIKKQLDSLKKLTGFKIPSDPKLLKYQNLSDQDLLKAVNEKFLSQHGLEDSVSTIGQKVNGENQKIQKEIDLTKTKLNPDHLQNLVPAPGSLVNNKYLKQLDSIRNVDLKKARLKLSQKKNSAQTYLASIEKKQSFIQKSYFDGIAGIQTGTFTILQFSPAFATHFSKMFSLGAGPNFSLKNNGKDFITTTGLRTFMKAEFLKRQVYTQAEDQINQATTPDGAGFTHHNFLLGGGCLIPFMRPLTLNVALMYKVYSNGNLSSDSGSPWVFRIGISSVKHKSIK